MKPCGTCIFSRNLSTWAMMAILNPAAKHADWESMLLRVTSLVKNSFANINFNLTRSRAGRAKGADYIPLAPIATSTGGLSYKKAGRVKWRHQLSLHQESPRQRGQYHCCQRLLPVGWHFKLYKAPLRDRARPGEHCQHEMERGPV